MDCNIQTRLRRPESSESETHAPDSGHLKEYVSDNVDVAAGLSGK